MGDKTETAILAGGCTWNVQELMRHCEGLISIRAGWTGGYSDEPTEDNPGGHAEAVEIIFDADRASYRDVLELFFQIHRPDLGENVVGSIYRSEIFYTSEKQRQVAEETIADLDAAGFWPGSTVTKVSEARRFLEDPAEEQNFIQRFPELSRLRPGVDAADRGTPA